MAGFLKEFTQKQIEGCSGFVFPEHFFECFIGSASSGPFQALFSRLIFGQLVTLICLKDRLVSHARVVRCLLDCFRHCFQG